LDKQDKMIKYNEGINPELLDKKLKKSLVYLNKASTFDIFVTSGFRTPDHNAEIGGSANSSHLKGLAIDLSCSDSVTRYSIIYWALIAGFRRIGIGSKHIHLDIDQNKPNPVIFFDNYK
jgi:zinc D-Ala-D-Ala carboxypeptidase